MKDNLSNIPELNLDSAEHFYVVGTKNRDGVLAGNYKVDLKKLSGGGNSGEDFSTQLKKVIRKTLQAQENLEVYFVPKYTNLFGPNCFDGATEEEMSILEPGTVLTMEQVFESSNYDFLKILFGIKDILTWIGFDSWGSGAPKSLLGEYGNAEYIEFEIDDSGIKHSLYIGQYWKHYIGIAFPADNSKGIVLDYDFETETFTVVEYGSVIFY